VPAVINNYSTHNILLCSVLKEKENKYILFFEIFLVQNVHTYGTLQVFCIKKLKTVQFVQHFLFFIQGEFWNLDHLVACGIPYANTYGIPVNFTAKNTAEFRGIQFVFQKIPYSVGSQKRTSLDTLVILTLAMVSQHKRCRTCKLLNAAHNVSILNIKVSKRKRHITYSVTKHTYVV
jgi:hypothetical protein